MIKELLIPLDRRTTMNGVIKSYNTYDQALYQMIKEIAMKEGTTVSAMIHRCFEMMEREYFEQK